MRRRRPVVVTVVMLGIAACASTPAPAPVVGQRRPSLVPPDPERCVRTTSAPTTIDGSSDAIIALDVCSTREMDTNYLVVLRTDKPPVITKISERGHGFEGYEQASLTGLLLGPTGNPAALVAMTLVLPSGRITLTAYRFDGTSFQVADSFGARSIRVSLSDDRHVATIVSCSGAETVRMDGCNPFETGAIMNPTVTWRWDGRSIVVQRSTK